MRNKFALLIGVVIGLMAIVAVDGRAQTTPPTPPEPTAPEPTAQAPDQEPAAADVPAALLSQADLEEMLGPIALYPDTLLANVLAAAVYPDELVAAHTYIKGGGAPATIDQQPWEAPVQSIAKVPEALNFLVDNIEWTTAIGEAYIAQSQDVMAAVQSLRAKAKAGGALQTSEQMAVVESGSNIIIEPSQPDVIYVPQYDPQGLRRSS